MSVISSDLVAADVMERDIVAIGPGDSLRDAVVLMIENHVSGLPVLDAQDRLVGVITATDILTFDEAKSAVTSGDASVGSYFDPISRTWDSIRLLGDPEELPETPVRDVMEREVVTVKANEELREVARTLTRNEIHRVLVVDQEDRLRGVISASDFVRLFAR